MMTHSSPRNVVFYLAAILLAHYRLQQVASAHQDSSSTHQVSSLSGGNSWLPSLPIGHIGVPLNGTLTSALLALQPRQSSSTSYSRIFRPNNSDTGISQHASTPTTSSPQGALATTTGSGAPSSSTSAPLPEQRSRFQTGNDIETSGSNINEMIALSSLQNVRHNKLTAAPHPGHGIVDMASRTSANNNNNESSSHEEPEATEEEESVAEEEPQQEQRFGRTGKTWPIHHSNQLTPAMMRSPVMSRHRPGTVDRRQQEPLMVQQRRESGQLPGRAEQQKYEQDEAAGRREQEAAEASEADLINKSALDEQRQQQREIIAAQAASDARAIKEQQELLLKQQLLQQQMISRRHQEIEAERNMEGRRQDQPRPSQHQYQPVGEERPLHQHHHQNQHQEQQQKTHDEDDEQADLPLPPVKGPVKQRAVSGRLYQIPQERRYQPHRAQHLLEEASRQLETAHASDNQFSDQLDMNQSASFKDEVYDFSVERKSQPTSGLPAKQVASQQPAQDLQPEAQRSFQTTAQDTLTGQHKDYFQFAESYKKGQFHSGYKRGGNKLQVSGHASQHVNQAEGHNKWNAPKGRGSSYWELKHGKKQRSKPEEAPEEANKEHF